MTHDNDETKKVPLDPVAKLILESLKALPKGKSLEAQQVARTMAEQKRKASDGPQIYRRYMMAVRQQAIFLARTKELEIIRRGVVVDPDDFKGVWRMRLPERKEVTKG